jgi:hypothetical protein
MSLIDPLPFIADHQLLELVRKRPDATKAEKRRWLLPETFRWRRDAERLKEGPDDLSKDWAWEEIPNRTGFLANTDQRLRVITVNAGAGKTIAALQSQYLLQQVHSDHLCLLINFSKLPTTAEEIWGPRPETSCLVRWFCERESTKDAPRSEIARMIGAKMRAGKLTLIVEAFDQTTKGKNTHDLAECLRTFLEMHPKVRCLCTGRPHAIVDACWEHLFQHGEWQFIHVDAFTKKQSELFVGPQRWKLCQKLKATELFVPRSLEAIRNIKSVEKLWGLRTASQLYWESLIYTLQKARDTQNPDTFRSPDGSWEIRTHHALTLFALLAFECNRQGFLDGLPAGPMFTDFFAELWTRHKQFLQEEFGLLSKPSLETTLTTLSRLNAAIDFAALDHDGITQVIFQNRTLQDFLAAIWMCTESSAADQDWFSEQRFVRWKQESRTHYQMWKMVVEMPEESDGRMIARKNATYVKTVSVLYEPSTAEKPAVRSTEMIWRSWPVLLQLCGLLKNGDWQEEDLKPLTRQLQREARGLVTSGISRPVTTSLAKDVLLCFLIEYPMVLRGSRGA